MNIVPVYNENGKPLMPTNSARARKLLRDNKAETINDGRSYFSIRLTELVPDAILDKDYIKHKFGKNHPYYIDVKGVKI